MNKQQMTEESTLLTLSLIYGGLLLNSLIFYFLGRFLGTRLGFGESLGAVGTFMPCMAGVSGWLLAHSDNPADKRYMYAFMFISSVPFFIAETIKNYKKT